MSFLKSKAHFIRIFVAGVFLLLLIILVSANFGTANISIKQTALIILSKVPIINNIISLDGINEAKSTILLQLRIPRIILACLVGATLAACGTAFQGIFKNPMADPFILGVSSGAALGATITMTFFKNTEVLGMSLITLVAFVFSIVIALLVYNIAKVGSKVLNTTLLLAGIAVNYLLSSIISLIMIFNRDYIENIIMWTMGGFSNSSWNQVKLLLIILIPCFIVMIIFSRDLNVMLLGEESAGSLGINVDNAKKIFLIISTIMVAAVVSVSGIIGFVGLIIPHAVRILVGSDNRMVIPFSAIGGAIFLTVCDTIGRSIASPAEIPVGIITSIFGVPFFILLLYKAKKKVL